MKRLIISCLCAAAVGSAWAIDPLVVRDVDRDTQVGVENLSHVVFVADGSVEVHCLDGSVITVPADKFVSLRFNTDRSGVEAIEAVGGAKLAIGANGVITSSVAGIAVYDAAGHKVASSESTELPTGGLQPGVYIVSAGGSSLKIAVK